MASPRQPGLGPGSPRPIAEGAPPPVDFTSVEALIEIPRGSRNKYEFDDQRGLIVLDRVLYSSVHYPTDYGFIPGTLAPDGDHLDVLVVVEEPTFPGCLVRVRPIGVLAMRDERGPDDKVLSVPLGDPRFGEVRALGHLSAHWLREIENFFAIYKRLEGLETEMCGWQGVDAAHQLIAESVARYRARETGALVTG